jgi:hypothetical protein
MLGVEHLQSADRQLTTLPGLDPDQPDAASFQSI